MTAPTPAAFDTAKLRSVARLTALKYPRRAVLDLECDAIAAAHEIDLLRQTITDAPHATHCSSLIPVPDPPRYPCNCWKKEVGA